VCRERERELFIIFLGKPNAAGVEMWAVGSEDMWEKGCPRGIQAGVLVNSKSNPCHCPNTQQPSSAAIFLYGFGNLEFETLLVRNL
jgi:hypothetical protein